MQEARVTIYSVSKCGFYRRGDKQPAFGGLGDTFQQLHQWSTGLELSLTKLKDLAQDSDSLPVYLLEMVPCGTGWIAAAAKLQIITTRKTIASHGQRTSPSMYTQRHLP